MGRDQQSARVWGRKVLKMRSVYLVGPALAAWLGVLAAAGSAQGCAVHVPPASEAVDHSAVAGGPAFLQAPCAPFGCASNDAGGSEADAGAWAEPTQQDAHADDVPCEDSEGCYQDGLCHQAADGCRARDEQDCLQSIGCKESALCSESQGSCVDFHDAVCRAGDGCTWAGRCMWSALASDCVAGETADCQASGFCRLLGRCTLDGHICRAGSDADCAQSQACELSGACTYRNGTCKKAQA